MTQHSGPQSLRLFSAMRRKPIVSLARDLLLLVSIFAVNGSAFSYCEDVTKIPNNATLVGEGVAKNGALVEIRLGPSADNFIRIRNEGEVLLYIAGVRSPNKPLMTGFFVTADICAKTGSLPGEKLIRVFGDDKPERILDVVPNGGSEAITVQAFATPLKKSLPVPPSKVARIKLQAKSFIGRMATQQSIDDGKPDAETTRNLGFGDLVGGRAAAYALMLLTDQNFSENPANGQLDDGQFRLWSELDVDIPCTGDSLGTVKMSDLKTAFGKEGPLEAVGEVWQKPMLVEHNTGGKLTDVDIQYKVKGRPNQLALPLFEQVRPRACTWIWHHVAVNVSCKAGRAIVSGEVRGSAFPSRRLWVNGDLLSSVRQGPFDKLWNCDQTEKGLVR